MMSCLYLCVAGVCSIESAAVGYLCRGGRLHVRDACQILRAGERLDVLGRLCCFSGAVLHPRVLQSVSQETSVEPRCTGESLNTFRSFNHVFMFQWVSFSDDSFITSDCFDSGHELHDRSDIQLLWHRHYRHGCGHYGLGVLYSDGLLSSGQCYLFEWNLHFFFRMLNSISSL